MHALSRELMAAEGFLGRQLSMWRRYMGWELVFLTYSMVNCLTIGLIGTAAGSPEQTLFLLIGAVLWGFLSVVFHEVAESMALERWAGTIEYTLMAPVRRMTHMGALCAGAVLYGSVRSLVVLAAAALFFDLDLGRANLFGAGLVLAASSMSFVGLGILASTLPLLSPEKGPQAAGVVEAAILLVSGVYYDVAVLPWWLRPLATVSPATYTLRGMRRAVLEGAGPAQLGGDLLVLVVAGLVLVPLGLRIFAAVERYALREGLLKRQG